MIRKEYLFVLLTGLALIFPGCDSKRVYEKNIELANGSWNKDSVLIFQIEVKDTISEHNLLLNVRNYGSYKYSNLFLFVRAISPKGSMIRDRIECTLAEKSGKWIGDGSGGLYHLQQLYKDSVRFPYPGIYTFEIQHGMREDNLEDIADIGFRLEKIDE